MIRLEIERTGITRFFEFKLQRASEILKQNQWSMINGRLLPAGLAEEDIKCFTQASSHLTKLREIAIVKNLLSRVYDGREWPEKEAPRISIALISLG